MSAADPWETWTKRARDIVLLALGIFIVLFEALNGGAVRVELLVLAATMMGLPAMFDLQKRRNGDKDDD